MSSFIKISSKREGFYRAGIEHHKTPHIFKEQDVKNKLAALKKEPMLDVTRIDEAGVEDAVEHGAIVTFEFKSKAKAEAEKKAAEEKAKAEVEKKAAEEKAKAEAEKKAAEEKAKAEAENKDPDLKVQNQKK